MTARLIFLFAGQGSQYPGMAAQLYREEPRFTAALNRFDHLVVELTGRSVSPFQPGGRAPGGAAWRH